ncbi:MAG: ATP-binding cassette domain-containing protein [Anaerolineae bacterium]|nr:MAG: ATP-binding cassette domain-containing protein [Anaerolineae bacterium]
MIQVEGLTKDYGARRAIDDIKFHAEKGEIVGFLGPNGAGKTTTMRILAGYMPATSGKAVVAGYDVMEDSIEVRRRVGYLPESVPLYTDMTVLDYLKYMGDLHGVANSIERAEDVLQQVDLSDRAETYIEYLSKGMRQRVGLAQALLHEPEVLILDEPTIGLDPAQIREVRALIQHIGKERTVLLSTHILAEAQTMCDRVLIINKGKIVAEDTAKNLEARLTTGGGRLSLRVKSKAKSLIPTLKALKGITDVELAQDGALLIETKPGVEVRPEVARTVIAENCDLLELRQHGMTLEEIFLELTAEPTTEG